NQTIGVHARDAENLAHAMPDQAIDDRLPRGDQFLHGYPPVCVHAVRSAWRDRLLSACRRNTTTNAQTIRSATPEGVLPCRPSGASSVWATGRAVQPPNPWREQRDRFSEVSPGRIEVPRLTQEFVEGA